MDSKKIGIEAAKKSTKIHYQIEKGFLGKSKTKPYKLIKAWLDENFPDEEWLTEDSFCADSNYSGARINLYSKSGIFVDPKLKDNLEGKDPAKLVYDEHGMQLSAYAQGCNIDNPQRVSIFIDRADTGLILYHIWDEKSHERHLSIFNTILEYYKLVKTMILLLTMPRRIPRKPRPKKVNVPKGYDNIWEYEIHQTVLKD